MNDEKQFKRERKESIQKLGRDRRLNDLARRFIIGVWQHKYSFNFDWLGRPIIQIPQDIVAMQELVWRIKPDLIIETGIARGGSLIFYASLLELIGRGKVIGIDIDIRAHNRHAIEIHSMRKRIIMLEGSSTDEGIVRRVKKMVGAKKRVMVCLDSSHTHNHVLRELELYSPLVSRGSYVVVFDTIIESMPKSCYPNRPWGRGNNPLTAVNEFLKTHKNFTVDKTIDDKLLLSVAPGGYLKRIR